MKLTTNEKSEFPSFSDSFKELTKATTDPELKLPYFPMYPEELVQSISEILSKNFVLIVVEYYMHLDPEYSKIFFPKSNPNQKISFYEKSFIKIANFLNTDQKAKIICPAELTGWTANPLKAFHWIFLTHKNITHTYNNPDDFTPSILINHFDAINLWEQPIAQEALADSFSLLNSNSSLTQEKWLILSDYFKSKLPKPLPKELEKIDLSTLNSLFRQKGIDLRLGNDNSKQCFRIYMLNGNLQTTRFIKKLPQYVKDAEEFKLREQEKPLDYFSSLATKLYTQWCQLMEIDSIPMFHTLYPNIPQIIQDGFQASRTGNSTRPCWENYENGSEYNVNYEFIPSKIFEKLIKKGVFVYHDAFFSWGEEPPKLHSIKLPFYLLNHLKEYFVKIEKQKEIMKKLANKGIILDDFILSLLEFANTHTALVICINALANYCSSAALLFLPSLTLKGKMEIEEELNQRLEENGGDKKSVEYISVDVKSRKKATLYVKKDASLTKALLNVILLRPSSNRLIGGHTVITETTSKITR